MYRTLRAEMVRANLSVKQLAMKISITERSLRNKINGITEFSWTEVKHIRDIVAPNMTLEELFKKDESVA